MTGGPNQAIDAERIRNGFFFAVGATLALSLKSVIAKSAYRYGVAPATLLELRLWFAAPALVATMLWRHGLRSVRALDPRQWTALVVLAVFGMAPAMLASFAAISRIDAGLATLVTFVYPALTVLLMRIAGRTRFSVRVATALAVTSLGLALVVPVRDLGVDVDTLGIVLALISAIAFAFYNTVADAALERIAPVTLMAIVTSITAAVVTGLAGLPGPGLSAPVVGHAALLGLATGYVPFLLFATAVTRIGTPSMVIISAAGPALTVLWAALVLDERLGLDQLAGMAMMVVGIASLKLRPPFELWLGRAGALHAQGHRADDRVLVLRWRRGRAA